MTIVLLPNGTYTETPTYKQAQRQHRCFWCGQKGGLPQTYQTELMAYALEHQSYIYQCPQGHIFFVERRYEREVQW